MAAADKKLHLDEFDEPETPGRGAALGWLVGLALLAVVVVLGARQFEGRRFLELTLRASPAWLAAAFALQAFTYWGQGEVWRAVGRAADRPVSARGALLASLAKLFMDQTIPSAGFSGTVFAARALERRGLPRRAASACVGVNMVSYYLAYATALTAAALSAAVRGRGGWRLGAAAGAFVLVAAATAAVFLRLSGRAGQSRLARLPVIGRAARYFDDADPLLLRSPGLLVVCWSWQLSVIAADAATLWVLVRAVGASASTWRLFGSFMISSTFRSIALSPGGLGAFEASSVITLKRIGLPMSAALSATLLFRGLSFWLPMAPGFWAYRREAARPRSG